MTWYFTNTPCNDELYCVTPRVASTSQRKLYASRGWTQLSEEAAKAMADAGATVHGVIRDPLARLISAYQRHKPGSIRDTFQEYTAMRATWDAHVMPQTQVHDRSGITITDWITFEELVASDYFPHCNATPGDHKKEIQISLGERWIEWYKETFAEDIALYARLAQR